MSSVSLFLPFSLTKIFWNFRYLSVIWFFHCLPSGSMTDLQLSPFRPSIHSSTLIIWYTVIPFYCHHHWLCTFPWMQGDLRHAEESSTSQVCIVTTATNPQTQRTTIIASDSSQVSKIRGVVEAMDKIFISTQPCWQRRYWRCCPNIQFPGTSVDEIRTSREPGVAWEQFPWRRVIQGHVCSTPESNDVVIPPNQESLWSFQYGTIPRDHRRERLAVDM